MDLQQLGDPLEGEPMSYSPNSFFDYSNSTLDLWYMLIGTGQVDARSTWHPVDHSLEGSKFAITADSGNAKAPMEI